MHANWSKFKKVVLSFNFLFVFGILDTQSQELIRLPDAIMTALENNLHLKKAKLNEVLSELTLRESKLALLPSVTLNNGVNSNFGRSVDPFTYDFVNRQILTAQGNLTFQIPLFQGYQRIKQIALSKYQLELTKTNAQKIENELIITVISTYLEILNTTEVLTAAKRQTEIAKAHLINTQRQFELGNRTVSDVSETKAQATMADLNVVNSQNKLEMDYLTLAQLMERDPQKSFIVEIPLINDLREDEKFSNFTIFSNSVDQSPEVQISKYNKLAALKSLEIAKGSLYPRLSLVGNAGSGYSSRGRVATPGPNQQVLFKNFSVLSQVQNNFSQSIGVYLSVPVFNGLASRMGVKKARVYYEEAVLNEQITRNTFNKIINQSVADYNAAKSTYESSKESFRAYQESFNAASKRFKLGLITSLDFLNHQNTLNTAEFHIIKAKYDLLFKRKIIEFYMGSPMSLH